LSPPALHSFALDTMASFPLGNILTTIGCIGSLAMLPHMVMPDKMCKMFLAEKFTDDVNVGKQLVFIHFGLFSNLFWLAVTVAVAGQTCACLPVGYAFCFIIFTRLIQVAVGFWGAEKDKIGLAKKPVMLQVVLGTVIWLVALVSTILASQDAEYLAEAKIMEDSAFEKMEDGAPLVYFLIGIFLFFALMSAPGMCMPDKMIDGYIPTFLRTADNYAAAQAKFYMSFQSREQFFFWLLLAALVYMSPDITAICITIICLAVYFMGFCLYAILNNDVYQFALPGMLFWLICMATIMGATSVGLFLI